MLQFQGFKPDALNRMAKTMGYSGDMGEFNKFLNENPEKQEMMDVYSEKAKEKYGKDKKSRAPKRKSENTYNKFLHPKTISRRALYKDSGDL